MKEIVFEDREKAQEFIVQNSEEISDKIEQLEEKINTLLCGHLCIDKITVCKDNSNYYIVYLSDVAEDFAEVFESKEKVKQRLEELLSIPL